MNKELRKVFQNDAIQAENFDQIYFDLNKYVNQFGQIVPSRNGQTKEILNFKTTVVNPYQRLVGGHNRCVNPFFLMAEAIWIVAGRNDVALLDIFNSNMKNYSDNGDNFHAAYGYRLKDQIPTAIKMLSEDSFDRRVVLQIWDKDLDLGKKSKDIPCNDLLMLKVRDGQLHSTIANRSNDLHWGLLTNVYQFSFLTECIAECLDLELGTQTHNSQSLHVYTDLELNSELLNHCTTDPLNDYFYDNFIHKILSFNFKTENKVSRWLLIKDTCDRICDALIMNDYSILTELYDFSDTLYFMTSLLLEYSSLKSKIISKTDLILGLLKKNEVLNFKKLNGFLLSEVDFFTLSINFLYTKLNVKEKESILSKISDFDLQYLQRIEKLEL